MVSALKGGGVVPSSVVPSSLLLLRMLLLLLALGLLLLELGVALLGNFLQLLGAALPGLAAKDGFHILAGDDFAGHLGIHNLVLAGGVGFDEVFGALILLIDYAGDFLVDNLGALVAVGMVAHLALRVVVADVGLGYNGFLRGLVEEEAGVAVAEEAEAVGEGVVVDGSPVVVADEGGDE